MDFNRIIQKLGICELNDMQMDAINAIQHSRNDVLVLSPTGTGKTLAYLLPLIQLIDPQSDDVQALVIVPGRELALQSDTVLKNMGSGLRSQSCYGGRTAMEEHRLIKQNRPQIVFGTPGRLNDHLDKRNIAAGSIRYLVIDEFDKCLEMGFQEEMGQLLGKLPALKRRILLSATDAEQIPRFVELGLTTRIDYLAEEHVSERVEIYQVDCPQRDKLDSLFALLCQLGDTQSIVFLNYRDSVKRTYQFLLERGFVVSQLHGGMEQRKREESLYQFTNGSANVLVATDLASRGLDIPHVENIIHYHLPQNEEALVHRVGRSARWDALGRTFFLIGPEEQLPIEVECENWLIEENAHPTIPSPHMATIYIGKGKKDKISKSDIVGFLCKKGGILPSEIGRIDVKDRYAYAAISTKKVNQVLQLVKGEKIKGIRTIVEPIV